MTRISRMRTGVPTSRIRAIRVIRGFILFLLFCLARSAGAAPDLFCAQTNYSFGVLTDDTNVTHRFRLENRGDAPLRIARVKAGCACARADVSPREIPPGGSADLTVELILKGLLGKQDHPTWVFSNDPDTPRFAVTCQGEIRLDVEVRPRLVYGQQIAGDAMRTHEVAVSAGNGKTVRVLGLETNDLPFCAVRLETVKPDHEYRLKIAPAADALSGAPRREGKLAVVTDSPKYPRVEVAVTLVRVAEVAAVPDEIRPAPMPPEAPPPEWSVLLRSQRERPFEIL